MPKAQKRPPLHPILDRFTAQAGLGRSRVVKKREDFTQLYAYARKAATDPQHSDCWTSPSK